MFSLFKFSSIFPGWGSADPICPYVRTPMHDRKWRRSAMRNVGVHVGGLGSQVTITYAVKFISLNCRVATQLGMVTISCCRSVHAEIPVGYPKDRHSNCVSLMQKIEFVRRQFTQRFACCGLVVIWVALDDWQSRMLTVARLHLYLIHAYKIIFGLVDADVTSFAHTYLQCLLRRERVT